MVKSEMPIRKILTSPFVWILVLCCGAFFFLFHSIKPYSDPYYFLIWATEFNEGQANTERPLAYPAVLGASLKLVGPIWAFLTNLPFHVLLLFSLCGVAGALWLYSNPKDVKGGVLAGISASAFLLYIKLPLFFQVLNPYRETFAFSLLFIGLFYMICLERRPWVYGLLGGIFLGLSTSVRETGIIALGCSALWILGFIIRNRSMRWVGIGALTLVGVLIGLLPFFIQNHLHSKSAIVPGYISGTVLDTVPNTTNWTREVEEQVEKKWDIPVPGMSLSNFPIVGPHTLQRKINTFKPLGLAFLALGFLFILWRKNKPALALIVPNGILYFIFYSFYEYHNARYTLIFDLFSCVLIGLGVAWLVRFLARLLRTYRGRSINFNYANAAVLILLLGFFAHYIRHNPTRLRVWEVPSFIDWIQPQLDKDCVFIGNRHYGQMFSWFLEGERSEIKRRIKSHAPKELVHKSLEVFLEEQGHAVTEEIATKTHYIYGESERDLLRYWFDYEPVLDFRDSPVPINRYSNVLTNTLYQVKNWSALEVERTIKVPAPGEAHVLMLNPFRINDIVGRGFSKLSVNDRVITNQLQNGMQYLRIPPALTQGDKITLRIESDKPLSRDFSHQLLPLNKAFSIPFGFESPDWYLPHVGLELCRYELFSRDSFYLFDRGRLSLPRVADTNTMIVAHLKYEYVQGDEKFRREEQAITARTEQGTITRAMPAQNTTLLLAVPLGRGTGTPDMIPVELNTPLPRAPLQDVMRDQLQMTAPCFTKLYESQMVMYHVPQVDNLEVDVGNRMDAPYLVSGFYHRTGRGERPPLRWMEPQSEFMLPLVGGKDYQLIFRSYHEEGEGEGLSGECRFEGTLLEPLIVRQNPEKNIRYMHYKIPAALVTGRGDYRVSLKVGTQKTNDKGQALAICLDKIIVSPL